MGRKLIQKIGLYIFTLIVICSCFYDNLAYAEAIETPSGSGTVINQSSTKEQYSSERQAEADNQSATDKNDTAGDESNAVTQDNTEVEANTTDKDTPAEQPASETPADPDHQEATTNTDSPEDEKGTADTKPDTGYIGKITLNNKKLSLKQGDTYQLKATLTKENLTGKKIKFASSDTKIITVSQKGVIKAVHYGVASVTVSLEKVKAVCKVTVTKDVTITISAAGDCTLSSDIKQPASINFFSVYNQKKDSSYFFKNVKPIFEKDDMTIVNFEGTLSTQGKRVDKQWAFRGKPSYINILKEGSVETVAFANNHVKDYGEVSYNDTIKYFKKAGLTYSSFSQIGVYETKGMKIGMISILETDNRDICIDTLRKAIKEMKKEKPDLLVVSFHWGNERTSVVTRYQKELSRIAIDEGGADLVLGHHPHVLQPVEKYKDAYIVYSLGNFCFGGNTNPPDKDTMIYQQTFTFHNDKLVPDDNVKITPCSVSSVSSRNNYQPTPSKGSEKTRIIRKINGYCKQYGISFDSKGKVKVTN